MAKKILSALAAARGGALEITIPRGVLTIPPPSATPAPALEKSRAATRGLFKYDDAHRALFSGRCIETNKPFELPLRWNARAGRYFPMGTRVPTAGMTVQSVGVQNNNGVDDSIAKSRCPHCRSPLVKGECRYDAAVLCRPQRRANWFEFFSCPGHCHGL